MYETLIATRRAAFGLGMTLTFFALPMATSAAAPSSPGSAAETADAKLPAFATVKTVVESLFSQNRQYRSGDLVSQSQVANVLTQLNDKGWEVAQSRELLARVPADDEFLVRALRTPQGMHLMRRVSTMKGGYDRVDRLSRIPDGPQIVQKLIEGPDGHKLIGYMTDSRGGKELGKMLGRTAHDGDLNKPTGRIYTEKQLLTVLEKLHAAEGKRN